MDWSDLTESVRVELGLLHQLMDESTELHEAVRRGHASAAQRLAVGTVLQSFYNSAESIFGLILEYHAEEHHDELDWRHRVLPLMSASTANRPAVIDQELRDHLQDYLDFREVFRYGEFFKMRWNNFAPLLPNCPAVLARLEKHLETFLSAVGERPVSLAVHTETLPAFWTTPNVGRRRRMTVAGRILIIGITLMVGGWLGIAGMMLHRKMTAAAEARPLNVKLIRPYLAAAVLPKIPGMDNPPAQSLPLFEDLDAGAWTFKVKQGRLEAAGLSKFHGVIIGVSGPRPAVELKFDQGKIERIRMLTDVYHFVDGHLRRYEFDPVRGIGEADEPWEMWHLDPAGRIVRMSTAWDQPWRPKWRGKDSQLLEAGRWEFFWDGRQLVLETHTDLMGRLRRTRTRSGKEWLVTEFDRAGNPIIPPAAPGGEATPIDAKLVAAFLDAAVLPNIPAHNAPPQQLLPDAESLKAGEWRFSVIAGELTGDDIAAARFTGKIVGSSTAARGQVELTFNSGELETVQTRGDVYRFVDGRLRRYEVNPTFGDDPVEQPWQIWHLDPAGRIVHMFSAWDKSWTPAWLPAQTGPLDAGRWEFFWDGDQLVLETHTDLMGQLRRMRLREGEAWLVIRFDRTGRPIDKIEQPDTPTGDAPADTNADKTDK